MALLAESLVEEWLNRRGFFTIRGLKSGQPEINLLGVKQTASGVEGWHVEVQVSFKPMSYIAPFTKEIANRKGIARVTAVKRTSDELRENVRAWVEKKFTRPAPLRDSQWPGVKWRYVFVHGAVKYPEELREIAGLDVELVDLESVLDDLMKAGAFAGSAGSALADIIRFYHQRKQDSVRQGFSGSVG